MWFFITLLTIAFFIFGLSLFERSAELRPLDTYRLPIYFLFYFTVSFEIIRQVVTSSSVDRKVILGLISGYVSLGLIGFFIFLSIEMAHPNSIYGLTGLGDDQRAIFDQIMYFSYITLLTIGYGDLLPVTALAQKASILIGIMGQLYLTIITATIVGKFIGQWSNKRDSKNPKDKISDNG
ncbi:MAG: hypothetical protein GY816_02100 [Cytophagales bacterium]|nr:hypothetical protein [Cytophagales bacterium]